MRLRPLPDNSLDALWLLVRLLWSSLWLRVGEGSSLSAWSFPFRGLSPFSCLFLSWRPCRSRSLFPSPAPSWWWPCPLLRWAFLTLSGYVLSVPSAVFFASVLLIDPIALSPLLHRVFADGFRHWCAFCLCGGASPHAFGSIGALAVAPPISPYTGPGWSPPICRVALELRSVFPIFLCDIPHVYMAIILSVSLTPACPGLIFTIGCSSLDT